MSGPLLCRQRAKDAGAVSVAESGCSRDAPLIVGAARHGRRVGLIGE